MNNHHRPGITIDCHSRSVCLSGGRQVVIVSRPVLIDGTAFYNSTCCMCWSDPCSQATSSCIPSYWQVPLTLHTIPGRRHIIGWRSNTPCSQGNTFHILP